jgi:hypothetical protein
VAIAAADLDADGLLDLVVANRGSNDVSVLVGRGDGTFAEEARLGPVSRPVAIAVGDVDADGLPDLVVANDDTDDVSVLFNRGKAASGR